MFVRTVTVTIPTGREDEMYAFWEWASTYVRRQPGYIRGQLWRDASDPQQFTELHVWQSAEDSAAYRATEQFRIVIERLVALAAIPPRSAGYYVERE